MKKCDTCPQRESVYNAAPVPFVVHENLRAQMTAANRRLIRVIVLLIILLVVTNLGWIYYESQFTVEETHTEIEQDTDGGGDNYVIGGDFNGEAKNKDDDQDADP